MFRVFAVSVVTAILAMFGFHAWSMSVSPIVVDLETLGTGASASITVTNPSEADLPVEIVINRIEIDETGQVTLSEDAGDDFLVLPPLARVPAGSSQNFRLQYLGEPDLDEGQLFQFAVDQVPVELEESDQAQIQIVYSITGLMTLSVPSAPSQIEVIGAGIAEREEGGLQAQVTVRNSGKNYAYLSRGSLDVRALDGDQRTVWREGLSANRIEKEIGFGLVTPDGTRTFTLPYDLPEDAVEVAAEFSAAP